MCTCFLCLLLPSCSYLNLKQAGQCVIIFDPVGSIREEGYLFFSSLFNVH